MKKAIILFWLMAMGAGALEINNKACTNVTTTSAWFNAEIVSGTNPVCTLYYGKVDYSNTTSWASSSAAITGVVGDITTQATNMTPGSVYYFTWRAVEAGTTNWAEPSSNVWIKITPPVPPSVSTISLHTDTNGVLKAPTNFFVANSGLVNAVVSQSGAVDYGITNGTAYRGDWGNAVSNLAAASASSITSLEGSTNTLGTAVGDLQTATNALNANKLDLSGGVMTGGLTNEYGFYGDGSGLTNLPDGGTETDPVFTNWVATNAYVKSETDPMWTNWYATNTTLSSITGKVEKTGDTMTGPLTNEHGFYGDGSGLTNLPVSTTVEGAYPAFALPVGLVDGSWSDFEIKASTNNFQTLLYYYRSWTNDFGTNTDSDALVLFTDDYAVDPRQHFRKTNDISIFNHFLSADSVCEWVYFYPSTNLASVPAAEWMTATNPALVWSWSRVDALGHQENIAGNKIRWSKIEPVEWLIERPTDWEWGAECTNQLASTAEPVYFPWQSGLNISNRVVALEGSYQAAYLLADTTGSCTIAVSHGPLVKITAATSPTTIAFDNAGYATSGVSRVAVMLWAGTNSIVFDGATITNVAAPTISTTNWVDLLFRRTADNAKWKGYQLP